MMLAHAASAQGISVVENICDRAHEVNHDAIPAACFTHPEIAMVGPTEEQAIALAEKEGWPLGKSQGSFRANSKALAELEGMRIATSYPGLVADHLATLGVSARVVRLDGAVENAVRLAQEKKVGCLPVMDAGKVVGILTRSDFLKLILGRG